MVLDYLCCDPIHIDPDDEGFETSVASDSIGTSADQGILECDYDTHVTKLYHAIEERQWESVMHFMEHNTWSSSASGDGGGGISGLFGFGGGKNPPPPTNITKPINPNSPAAIEARTWVTALDASGHVRWCQLPLHAAVTFLAPHPILKKLVELYPKSVRCADDQDMLPLHYAFRFGADDVTLKWLIEKFPQAIGKAAVQDRLPLDLAQYGPRPERGAIIDAYMQSAVKNAKAEWDFEYERTVTAAAKRQSAATPKHHNGPTLLEQKLQKQLAEVQRELHRSKKELQLIQREQELDQREQELEQQAALKSSDRPRSGLSGRFKRSSTPTSTRRKSGNAAVAMAAPEQPPANKSTTDTTTRVSLPSRTTSKSPQPPPATKGRRKFGVFGKKNKP